jgi:SAM-dependent methyltransferase
MSSGEKLLTSPALALPDSTAGLDARKQTLSSFDWQWAHLPSGDFMPGDRWFDENSVRLMARELCAIDPAWFRDKRVLDAGCGQGRWSRALLDLGADVLAVDFSEAGLVRTREVCGNHPRLHTCRVDLLDLPSDVAQQRFDFVFSFGVLHHTGDTWRALENVASLVGESGAMFLYLYGSTSWDSEHRREVDQTRHELAELSFDQKIAELRRRFPGLDPHQLFDLMSPVINDRVAFDDVAERLAHLGFDMVIPTITHGEVYLRATRPSFPREALLTPVQTESELVRESSQRWLRRAGAAFEMSLRGALKRVPRRSAPLNVQRVLTEHDRGTGILDVSLPPERLTRDHQHSSPYDETVSPAVPGALADVKADVVVSLGASLGACRYPADFLLELWHATADSGLLLVELPNAIGARRSILERVRDARRGVPEKVAELLTRHLHWCSGHALHAVGGISLLNPLDGARARELLTGAGAAQVEILAGREDTILLTARRA